MGNSRVWAVCGALLLAVGCKGGEPPLGQSCSDGECPGGQVCNTDEVCVEENFDADGDGALVEDGDCDDGDADVYPGAEEVPYDGIDNDCADGDLIDVDGDGHAAEAVGGTDCNDDDSAINTDATEVCNLVDDDCDGTKDVGGIKPLVHTVDTASFSETTSLQFHPNGKRMQYERRVEITGDIKEWSQVYDESGNPLLDRFRQDDGKDGTWEAESATAWDYDYDSDGNAVVGREDVGDDMTVDKIFVYGYDAAGRRVSEASDVDADGTAETLWLFAYDANGKMTLSRFESPVGVLLTEHVWQYDAAGSLASEVYTLDSDGDGSINSVTERHYDSAGNEVLYLRDNDGNGQWTRQESRGYNADGNQTFMRVESPYVDGTSPTYEELWTYDSTTGFLALNTRDPDGVGPNGVNYKIVYSSDANGITSAVYDTDNDLNPEFQIFYEYDANGNRTLEARENPFDNGNSITSSETFEYDGNNRRTRNVYYNGEPLVANALRQYLYTHDADGRQTYSGYDNPYGGPLELWWTREFDALGNETRYELDSDGDGTPDVVRATYYVYDESGNMVRRAEDIDANTTEDTVETWQYSPPCEAVPPSPLNGDANACHVGSRGRCFKADPVVDYDGSTCHCDENCVAVGDCCADYIGFCGY